MGIEHEVQKEMAKTSQTASDDFAQNALMELASSVHKTPYDWRHPRNGATSTTYDSHGNASETTCWKYEKDGWCSNWTSTPLFDATSNRVRDPGKGYHYSHGLFDILG